MTTTKESDIILKFGKHKGETLDAVPSNYKAWLSEQDWIDDSIKLALFSKAHIYRAERDREREEREDFEGDMIAAYADSQHGDWGNRE